MNERRLATLLFVCGMFVVSAFGFFDVRWSSSSPLLRAALVVAVIATAAGLALDVKHRREDKRLARGSRDAG